MVEIALTEVMLRRQAELSKTLAGCAAIYPAKVLQMLERLNISDLQDERARLYLTKLSERADEIQEAAFEEQVEIALKVAVSNGLAIDYCKWIVMPEMPLQDTAEDTLKDIKMLVISRKGVESLQDYIQYLQVRSRWGKHGTRSASKLRR